METLFLLILTCILARTYADWNPSKRVFGKPIKFGVSTAAYQVEGAWEKHAKGETALDHFYHHHNPTPDQSNGDITSDSYNRIKQDVHMLRELGVDHYRFSMSWSRVLPTGFTDFHNQDALNYYKALLDELAIYNIDPMVTLYYYDLPQPIQEKGGWLNPNIGQWFEEYAESVFSMFSRRVKYWISINNPAICYEMYGGGKMPPALNESGTTDYHCIKNMLMAHARVYRLYDEGFKNAPGDGSLGISVNMNWIDPYYFQKKHSEEADLFRAFAMDIILDPLYHGDFPKLVKDTVKKRSLKQGYTISRLPVFSKKESAMLKNSFDFIGVNYQTSFYIRRPNKKLDGKEPILPHLYADVVNVVATYGNEWPQSVNPMIKGAPYGLYKALQYLIQKNDSVPISITELCTWPTRKGTNDKQRVKIIIETLKSLLLAIEDHANVQFVTFHPLMDGFDWKTGFTERHGLYEVAFNTTEKTRWPRHSAYYVQKVIKDRMVVEDVQFPKKIVLEPTNRRKKEEL